MNVAFSQRSSYLDPHFLVVDNDMAFHFFIYR